MTPDDNIDSPAAWAAPDGRVLVIATAKATDRLVVYDGATGETLRHVGRSGAGEGEFDRPNGVAVVDELLFVVERDNRRVQVRSEEHTSELQSLMRISYAVFCLKKKKHNTRRKTTVNNK